MILKGDEDCYDKARKASDGFEHGFLEYGEIRELSTDVRHRMAGYVRTAMLEMSGLEAELLTTLTTDPFDKPLGYWPLAKYIRGTLVGGIDNFPAPGHAYPFIEWNPAVKSSKLNADGTMGVEITENLKVKTPEGIGYQQKSMEVWEPG